MCAPIGGAGFPSHEWPNTSENPAFQRGFFLPVTMSACGSDGSWRLPPLMPQPSRSCRHVFFRSGLMQKPGDIGGLLASSGVRAQAPSFRRPRAPFPRRGLPACGVARRHGFRVLTPRGTMAAHRRASCPRRCAASAFPARSPSDCGMRPGAHGAARRGAASRARSAPGRPILRGPQTGAVSSG